MDSEYSKKGLIPMTNLMKMPTIDILVLGPPNSGKTTMLKCFEYKECQKV